MGEVEAKLRVDVSTFSTVTTATVTARETHRRYRLTFKFHSTFENFGIGGEICIN